MNNDRPTPLGPRHAAPRQERRENQTKTTKEGGDERDQGVNWFTGRGPGRGPGQSRGAKSPNLSPN